MESLNAEYKTDIENLKNDLQNRPKGPPAFGAGLGSTQESPLKKLALGLTQKLSNSLINNAISIGADSNKPQ